MQHASLERKMSSREFNQDLGKAKRAADEAPVIITDRGRPAYVLMTYDEFTRRSGERKSIVDLLNHEESKNVEFEPERMRDGWLTFEFD